ncbi:Serine/threonine-protein phosphatase 2A activator 2 [Gurleya vavrai]
MTFPKSNAFLKIKNFLELINNSVKTEKQLKNPNTQNLILSIRKILDKTALVQEVQRFGNSGFINFYDSVKSKINKIISNCNFDIKDAKTFSYVTESFGNATRIDYGTGHELNFLCFLYVLNQNGFMQINECFYALDSYFDLVRDVIYKYNLEPAGSHGVWGIDDYQLIPFILGSAELIDSEYAFEDLLVQKNKDFVYAKALIFIQKHKCRRREVSFDMHSPILYKMREKSWLYNNVDLMNHFENDVLKSHAVYQHFIYTGYLSE